MAKQDVQVREVDVIKEYNRKFGEFQDTFIGHLHQLLKALHMKLENMQQMQEDIRRERELIDEEIRIAHQRWKDSYDSGDDRFIFECRQEYDHLSGSICPHAQHCKEAAHNCNMSAKQSAGFIEYKTKFLEQSFQSYVSRGRQFLEKAAVYVEQYKDNNPNA